ncbi:Steroid 5-alpha-reductase DET2 [Bienertia sinuspersici]
MINRVNANKTTKDYHFKQNWNGNSLYPAFSIWACFFSCLPRSRVEVFLDSFVSYYPFSSKGLLSGVALDAAIPISLSYFFSTVTMIYAQHVSGEFPEPSINLQYAGVGLFLLGIGGNLYHHYILSTLRRKGEKEYKIPKGGLFNLVICPHYLFEVLGFVGVSCIAQTPYTLAFTAGTTIYLMGRSYATKKWYLSKFEDFPKDVKAFLPFIF